MIEREAGSLGEGRLARLIAVLDRNAPIILQTHDYPDIDAVASAWALSELLARRGLSALPAYRGEIRSRSLLRMIAELRIELVATPVSDASAQIVVVDGSPLNGNVELYEGSLVGIIDHHRMVREPTAPFLDIRPDCAACATIVHSYWLEAGEPLPRHLATALLAGIQSDTDFLSRRASPADFDAYTALFRQGDWDTASMVVRSVLSVGELELVQRALRDSEIRGELFYAKIPGPCAQELLAVLAEFVLRAEELSAAVVVESGDAGVHLSARSKDCRLSAFELVRAALSGIGTGGGHSHSAGGFVPAATFPGDRALKERFFSAAQWAAQHT